MGLFSGKKNRSKNIATKPLLSYDVANLQGLGTRERQEDSFAFSNVFDVTEVRRNGLLAVMADGMGGLSDGKRASEACIASLLSDYSVIDRGGDIASQFRDAIYNANEKIHKLFLGESGTTLACCFIYQERLFWFSVGDSYIYLKRGNGIYRVNQEHNIRTRTILENIRSGIIMPENEHDPDGHRLTEFLGKDDIEQIDYSVQPLPLIGGDVLLLCSDGVGGVVSAETLLRFMRMDSAQQICTCIEHEIQMKEKIHQDNFTALVIKCEY